MKSRSSYDQIAQREAITKARRRFYKALEDGMSLNAANDYSRGNGPLPKKADKPEKQEKTEPAKDRDEIRAVEISEDWKDLPYLPRQAGQPSLRSLAAQISPTPISNKGQAEEAIRAELALRVQESLDHLSHVTIPDDWQGMSDAEQIALAKCLSDETIEGAGDAERIIQTEIARRSMG